MQSYTRLTRHTATLKAILLQPETGATHRHSIKTPRKKKVVTSLHASPSVVLPSSTPSLPRCGPWLAPRTPARVAAPRHERGFRHYLSAAYGGREIVDARGQRGEWWMLRPADAVSGPRADRPGTWQKARPPSTSTATGPRTRMRRLDS